MNPLFLCLLLATLLLSLPERAPADEKEDRNQKLKEAIEKLAETIAEEEARKLERGEIGQEMEANNEFKKNVLQLAEAIAIQHKLKAPQRRIQTLIDALSRGADTEHLMRVLALREKNGFGIGPKAGHITPDGFEAKLESLRKKTLTEKDLEDQWAHLERAAYIAAAVAKVAAKKLNSQESKKMAEEAHQAALAFADAVRKKAPADIKIKAISLEKTCTACHDEFRAGAYVRVRRLMTQLKDPEPDALARNIHFLGTWKSEAKMAVPAILKVFRNAKPTVRRSCDEALKAIGVAIDPPFPALSQALQKEDAFLYYYFANEVGEFGDQPKEAAALLIGSLTHDDHIIRAKAADILGCLGSDAKEAIPQLVESLKDPDVQVRSTVVRALGLIDQTMAIAPLVESLRDPSAAVRGRAAQALAQIGPVVVPRLLTTLGDKNPDARGSAAYALGRLGPLAKQALPALRKAVKDDDPLVRKMAEQAVEKIGDDGGEKKQKKGKKRD